MENFEKIEKNENSENFEKNENSENSENFENFYDNYENPLSVSKMNIRFERISKEINIITDVDILKNSLIKNIIDLEIISNSVEFYKKKNFFFKKKISKISKNFEKIKIENSEKISKKKKELKNLRKENLENDRKKMILEKKIKNYDLIFKENLKEENIEKIFRENFLMVDKISCLERENNLYKKKLKNLKKKILDLKFSKNFEKIEKIKFEENFKKILKNQKKKIENLIFSNLNKIDLKNFRELNFENIFLKEELINLKLEKNSSAKIFCDFKINQINYEKLILKNLDLEILNENLIFEIKNIRKIFEGKNEEFEYFLKIIKNLNEKIFEKNQNFDFIKKFENFENRGFLDFSSLKKIFENFDIKISKYDFEILKKFFLVEENKNIHFRDLIFKLKIENLNFSNFYLKKNFVKIFEELNKLNMGPFELFEFFDIKNEKKIFLEDFLKGVENLNLKIDKFLIKSFFEKNLNFEENFFSKSEFINFFNFYLKKNSKKEFFSKNEKNWEFEIGNEILDYIYNNKKKYENIDEFFFSLDFEKKGFLNFENIENLFLKKLKLNFEKKNIENFFIIIDKKFSNKIFKEEFERFLKKCGDFNRIENKINNFYDFEQENENFENFQKNEKIKNFDILENKIEFLIKEKKILKENFEKLNFHLKQKNLSINFLEKKNLEISKNFEKLKNQIKKFRVEKNEKKNKNSKNQNSKINFFKKNSENENLKNFLKIEKKLTQNFLIQNENLKLQILKLEDENENLLNLKFSESSNLSKNSQKMDLMINYLNSKYDETDLKISQKNLKEKISKKNLEIFFLKEKIEKIKNKKFDLQIFLIEKINFLQKENLEKNEFSIFDIKKLNFVENQISEFVKNLENLQNENLELRKKNKNLEINFEILKKKNENFLKKKEIFEISNENLILKKYENLIEENSKIKISNIKYDKNEIFLKIEKENLEKKILNFKNFIKKLENEISVNFENFNKREKYWTSKFQDFLKKKNFSEKKNFEKNKNNFINQNQNPNQMVVSINQNSFLLGSNKENKILENLKIEIISKNEKIENLENLIKNSKKEKNLFSIESKIKEKKIISKNYIENEKILKAAQKTVKILKTIISEKNLEISELKFENSDFEKKILNLKNEKNILEILVENLKLEKKMEISEENFCEEKIILGVKKKMDIKKHDDYQILLNDYKIRINFLDEEKKNLEKLNLDLISKLGILKKKNNFEIFEKNEKKFFEKNLEFEKIKKENFEFEKILKNLEIENFDLIKENKNLKKKILEIENLKNFEIEKKNNLKKIQNSKKKDFFQKLKILKNQKKKIFNDFEILELEKNDYEEKYKNCNNKIIELNLRNIKKDEKILRLKKKIRNLNKNPIFIEEEKIEKLENFEKPKGGPKEISQGGVYENFEKSENLEKIKNLEKVENSKISKKKIFSKIIIKSENSSKFQNWEELILVLKTKLLEEKSKLLFLSKDLKNIFFDKKKKKLPEKILDLFSNYNIVIKIEDQRNFILWFLKYNKSDFFKNFYINIISLKNSKNFQNEKKIEKKKNFEN